MHLSHSSPVQSGPDIARTGSTLISKQTQYWNTGPTPASHGCLLRVSQGTFPCLAWLWCAWLRVHPVIHSWESKRLAPQTLAPGRCGSIEILWSDNPYMHLGRNWVIIGSVFGVSPFRCQAITSTNADALPFGPSGTTLVVLIQNPLSHRTTCFENVDCIWLPCCLSLNASKVCLVEIPIQCGAIIMRWILPLH